MLSLLRITNFALIDHLELTFGAGLNVLTGETGAGKSIILDAIDLVLGGKAQGRVVRQGAEQGLIEATFSPSQAAGAWLSAQNIDPLEDGALICSRDFSRNGDSLRSRSRVNGVLVNRQQLGELRELLVDITAQGQTVQFQEAALQRQWLDLYGGAGLLAQREIVEKCYAQAQSLAKTLQERRQSEQERLQRLDLLEFQRRELAEAQLSDPDELDHLSQEQERLTHVLDLQQLSYRAYQLLYQNDQDGAAITDLLGEAEGIIQEMTQYDNQLAPLLELLQTALTQVVEAGQQVRAYGDQLEADPQRLGEVEERLGRLKRLCRKYGPTLAEALALQETLERELGDIEQGEKSLDALEEAVNQAQKDLTEACEGLTRLRQSAAKALEAALVTELKPLALDKVIFVCQVQPCPPGPSGADQVTFYFSPNPGEPIQPLATTASGGEMSRFLLAFKACFNRGRGEGQTLIFDEIDAGVSGKVAQAIADKLHRLAQGRQALCVTHQPLVAALADVHFRVDKILIETDGAETDPELRTVIRVVSLQSDYQRQQELAQLAGGHSAQAALAFAESLLKKGPKGRSRSQ
ncbi:MAG: DNA repair protein RecN [Cyanobacteriota bacterium]|jgi:DNA repair protein RecN (Recombination protein N)